MLFAVSLHFSGGRAESWFAVVVTGVRGREGRPAFAILSHHAGLGCVGRPNNNFQTDTRLFTFLERNEDAV